MLSSSLCAILVTFVTSTVAASAAPSLFLKVLGPDTVIDVDNFKVQTIITNTGDQTLKVLNNPSSPLSRFPTNTFRITDLKGDVPAFTGVKVKYIPSTAIAIGKDAVTVLAPGQSVEIEHNLSEAYNFSKSGEGTYSVEASNLFYILDSENELVPLYARTEAHTSKLTGKLAVGRHFQAKRAIFNGCSASQQSALETAASDAQSYAFAASSYLSTHPFSTPRYTTWFGVYTAARYLTVKSHFSAISAFSFSEYTYDCACTDTGTYAYVYPSDFGKVYLCGAFWRAPATGTDSKAGTLIHESSHFTRNGGTDDHVYGQSRCKQLAISNPVQAVNNADSHEYFAENSPAQS